MPGTGKQESDRRGCLREGGSGGREVVHDQDPDFRLPFNVFLKGPAQRQAGGVIPRDPKRVGGACALESRKAGQTDGVGLLQFQEGEDGKIKHPRKVAGGFECGFMPPMMGSWAALGDRNDGKEGKLQEPLLQGFVHFKKFCSQRRTSSLFPAADQSLGAVKRNQKRCESLEIRSSGREDPAVRVQGIVARSTEDAEGGAFAARA